LKDEDYSENNACKQDEKRTIHHIFVPSCTKCSELLSKKLFAITIEIAQLSSIMIHLPILNVKDSINKLRSTPSVEATIQLLDLSTYYDEDETKQSVLQITLEDLEERRDPEVRLAHRLAFHFP